MAQHLLTQKKRVVEFAMHIPNCPLFESFEVCFESLFVAGRAMAFPCDRGGHVDLDALSPRARQNYLYARALIGRDFSYPRVRVAADTAYQAPRGAGLSAAHAMA